MLAPPDDLIPGSLLPQGENFAWVRDVIRAVGQGYRHRNEIHARSIASRRHCNYSINTALALGFICETSRGYELTARGVDFESATPGTRDEADLIAAGIQSNAVLGTVAPRLLSDVPPSIEELAESIERHTTLGPGTAARRAQTLLTWRHRITNYRLPLFDGFQATPPTNSSLAGTTAASPDVPYPVPPRNLSGNELPPRTPVMPLFQARKDPEQVFTPRSSKVNPRMYMERPNLERALEFAVRGPMHILIHGESGSGKSWLYKRVLEQLKVPFFVANLASASRLGAISAEFKNLVDRDGGARSDGYVEKKTTSVGLPGVAGGGLEHERHFRTGSMEPFEDCLRHIRKKSGGSRACLVLDNLEAIFDNPALMKELGDIITLLDDQRYEDYGIKLVLVGVPNGVREYFQKAENRSTIANRLYEVPEVSRLPPEKVRALVEHGFVTELRVDIRTRLLEKLAEHVCWITDGVPQRIHEYCLNLAFLAQAEAWQISDHMLEKSDRLWLSQSLSECYTAVQAVMNDRQTRVGRRNQVLYALGKTKTDEFRATDIEGLLRCQFPNSTASKRLNISGILSDLESRPNAIIKRTPRGDAYAFSDPRFRMCIRAMLVADLTSEAVDRIDISQV